MTFLALWAFASGIYFIGYWRGQRAVVKSRVGDT
jgi:hypothetical protein